MTPWIAVPPLDAATFAHVRRRAIFDCHKWDPQIGDSCTIAPHPLIITPAAWREVVRLAESLASETLAAEDEILHRPELHRLLGLPRAIRRALRDARPLGPSRSVARLMRFDFHFTTDGWRISEVNSDVPGGLNEASGFAALMAALYPGAAPVGDPVHSYVRALAYGVGASGTVAFVHATAYSDDQQMMLFVSRHLETSGVSVHLASPGHLRWRGTRAQLDTAWCETPLDAIVRFFPAEWLPDLPRETCWPRFFAGSDTALSNPASAILTQSKRFPLIWDALRTPLDTWRALLPETRHPHEAPWRSSDEWLVKPAFGRVGEGIGMRDLIGRNDMRQIARDVRWRPSLWIAQRRFQSVAVDVGHARAFPCLGVYTLDGRVVGAYGRVAPRPLIDERASDAGVLTMLNAECSMLNAES